MNNEPTKPKTLPNALSSQQWQSKSTTSSVSFQADPNNSPSPSWSPTVAPPLPPTCTGAAPANVPFTEEATEVHPTRDPRVLDAIGITRWRVKPIFTFGAFCDAERKVWVCRATSATGTQEQWIGPPDLPVTDATIQGASCRDLKDMLGSMVVNATQVTATLPYLPIGYVQAHEDVHKMLASASARQRYSELLGRINAISFPCTDYQGKGSAHDAMSNGIVAALTEFEKSFNEDGVKNANHEPITVFLAAQQAVCNPYLPKVTTEIAKRCPA